MKSIFLGLALLLGTYSSAEASVYKLHLKTAASEVEQSVDMIPGSEVGSELFTAEYACAASLDFVPEANQYLYSLAIVNGKNAAKAAGHVAAADIAFLALDDAECWITLE